jgi:hypothetical protein
MYCLIFSGSYNAGKSDAIHRLRDALVAPSSASRRLSETAFEFLNQYKQDFIAVWAGTNAQGNDVKVLVLSSSEYRPREDLFQEFWQKGPFDILICALRDGPDPSRQDFLNDLADKGISLQNFVQNSVQNSVPIPLIHIHGNKSMFDQCKHWYHDAVDKLTHHVLSNMPFSLCYLPSPAHKRA